MTYTKNTWVDRDVQYPNRYKDQNNNVLTLTRDEGTVNEAGTLFNAAKMNNIEDGIEALDTKLDELIETGNNANGNWIKYADGTMITYRDVPITIPINTSWGGIFVGNYSTPINFSQTFKEPPKVLIDIKFTQGAGWRVDWEHLVITNSSITNIGAARGTSSSASTFNATIFAIGKWK